MMFYVVVPLIAYILVRTNKLLAIAAIYLLSILYSTVVMQLSEHLNPDILVQLEQQLPGQMAFFISGALLYYFYDEFYNHAFWFLAIATLVSIVHNFVVEIYFLYPIALATVTIYFCLVFKYLGNFGKYGDFSYGLYIWHFPIMQVFVNNGWLAQPWISIPILFVSIFLVAYLSWHLIEKPFLGKRSHYVAAEAREKDYAIERIN